MEENRTAPCSTMSNEVLGCVMPYIKDPKHRDAVSLVCRRWYELNALTRKHVTIALVTRRPPSSFGRDSGLNR
ncbi:hypothetical protein SLA2020_240020 [Shorea laevis]